MLETLSGEGGLGFTLVPWQPVLDSRIGQHIAGVMRDSGGIDWSFGRKRGLGLWFCRARLRQLVAMGP
jgi:hypothetical protein